MARSKWLTFALMGMTLAGCASSRSGEAQEAGYQTVVPEPRRNIEAAQRENFVGLSHLAEGNLDLAARAFRRALDADIEFGPAHNNLGKVYYLQEDYYQAAWEFECAAELMPRHAAARNNLGLVLEQAGELNQAVERYREALGLEPDRLEYQANLARALVRRGDRTGELRRLLQAVVEHDTRPAWLIWARAQLSSMDDAP